MADIWFYVINGQRSEPVDFAALQRLASQGAIAPTGLVWREGLPNWVTAGSVQGLSFPAPIGATMPNTMPVPQPQAAAGIPQVQAAPAGPVAPGAPQKGVFGQLGQQLAAAADLPTIGDVPVQEILTAGLSSRHKPLSIEETFAVGTPATTPPLSAVETAWPRPAVFWRIFFLSLAAYFILRAGLTEFGNANCVPGALILGAFAVPFAVVVFFFEMNTPRNVSIYQVAKLLVLGGVGGILATLVLARIIPGSGVGNVIPALLTGLIEEAAKLAALLIVAREVRYRWQLNGLLFGAAVGAGFAGFETAGYAFRALLESQGSLTVVFEVLNLRGLLAPGGHVIWTAMIGSALWKAKGDKPFELGMLGHPVVVRRFLVAVILHGIWDMHFPILSAYYIQYIALSIAGWYLTFGILKQSFKELEFAKQTGMPMQIPAAA